MTEPLTVDGEPVDAEWTTSINLRVPLDDLGAGEAVDIGLAFGLTLATSPDAFSARLSSENGVLSFGQWFPILSTEHEVYGLGDPQISYTADAISLDLETTTPLARDAVACPGLVSAPDGTGTSWRCEVTDVRDFSFVVNPRFRLTETDANGTAIRVYTETVSGAATAELAQHGAHRPFRGLWRIPVARPRARGGRSGRRLQHGVPARHPPDARQGRPTRTSSTTRSRISGSTPSSATTSRSSHGWTRASPTSVPDT